MDNRLIFVLGILFVLAVPFVYSESETVLDVPNSPPVFVGLIPNFSFADGFLENAFDLDDYFMDLQDNLTYTFVSDSIDVVIDSENMVSFYPAENFIGIDTVVFIASDGEFNVSSNDVYVGVGVDLTPPLWFNPRKDVETKVYQNTNLTFRADWKDNFALGSFNLMINQLGSWEEYWGNFSGRENVSVSTIPIVAPPGKIVEWKICGFDLAMNVNCTDTYDFTVSFPPASPPGDNEGYDGDGTGDSITGESVKDLYKDAKDLFGGEDIEDFSVDVDSFFVELKQGTSATRAFEIINGGTRDLNFEIYVEGATDMILFSNEALSLAAGDSKVITVDFKAELSTPPGQYFGHIVIEGPETLVIPIVINVNNAVLDFEIAVDVLYDYENVKPGRNVVANINITNYGDVIASDVKLIYSIKDFYGNVYDSQEEVVRFDTVLNLEKTLVVPEEVLLGKYLFYASVSNEKDIAISSDVFLVGLSFVFEAFLKSSSVFIIILILSIVSIVLSFRYRNQKLKERALSLYVKLHEMKELIKEGDYDKAAASYVSIKKIYGEKISEDILKDKKKLSMAIEQLSKGIDFDEVIEASKEDEEKKEGNNEDGDKKTETEQSDEEKESEKVETESVKPDNDESKEEKTEEVESSKKDEEVNVKAPETKKEVKVDVEKKEENLKTETPKEIKKEQVANDSVENKKDVKSKDVEIKKVIKKEDPMKKSSGYDKLAEAGKKRGSEREEFKKKLRERLNRKNAK